MWHKESVVYLIVLFTAVGASAQVESQSDMGDASPQVVVARCAYTPADEACASIERASFDTPAPEIAAQFPRRPPRPRPRRPVGRTVGYGPGPWMQPNGRHAAIGALIGFGLGAAIGAKANQDRHPGAGVAAAFIVGSVGAGLGAVVGCGVPSFHAWSHRRHVPWPDEGDEEANRLGPVQHEAGRANSQSAARGE